MTATEFERFTRECSDELRQKQEALAELTVLDPVVQFDEHVITYVSEGIPFVRADADPLGSRGRTSGTWLWAWGNKGIPERIGAATRAVRELQTVTGRPEFAAAAPLEATEQQAWAWAAMACRHLGGIGVGRVTANDSDWFFLLRGVTHLRPEEELIARAETAVRESLLAARGPALLNLMRARFPTLRVNLIDADLRGAARPWAHDLHVQTLLEHTDAATRGLQELCPGETIDPGRFASHAFHDLSGANLSLARLDGAALRGVALRGASLDGASLVDADLSRADLRDASLRGAFLNGTNLTQANLAGADVTGAEFSRTLLANVDLSRMTGLDDIRHLGPSEVSMSTLIASSFEIDPAFLRRAGVSRGLIEDLARGQRFAGSYETCFLSYSSKDREFATRLYAALTDAGVRVFWDHFDVLPGEALERQIAEAIREHRRLLVVLSPASMASDWVEREVRMARLHRRESLLPVRLCSIEEIDAWIDGRSDVAYLAELPIQSFEDWRTAASFDHALSLVLKALGGGITRRQPPAGE